MYRVLSYILYYIIKNCVFIDYLCCQYKTLIRITSDKTFEQASYNILLGIGITEALIILYLAMYLWINQIQLSYLISDTVW